MGNDFYTLHFQYLNSYNFHSGEIIRLSRVAVVPKNCDFVYYYYKKIFVIVLVPEEGHNKCPKRCKFVFFIFKKTLVVRPSAS